MPEPVMAMAGSNPNPEPQGSNPEPQRSNLDSGYEEHQVGFVAGFTGISGEKAHEISPNPSYPSYPKPVVLSPKKDGKLIEERFAEYVRLRKLGVTQTNAVSILAKRWKGTNKSTGTTYEAKAKKEGLL